MRSEAASEFGGFPRTRLSLVEVLGDWNKTEKWAEFARIYSPIILAMARKAGLRDTDADDLLQNVLLSVAHNMRNEQRQYKAGRPFRGWLLNQVRWKIGEHIRTIIRRERDSSAGNDDAIAKMVDEVTTIPDDQVGRKWQEILFATAIERVREQVSARQFQIFQLSVLAGMTVKEVREQLDVSQMQVYLAKHRVGQLIRREIRRLENQTKERG
jgi:RNA polymerase sigma factor (sigma-70 family)